MKIAWQRLAVLLELCAALLVGCTKPENLPARPKGGGMARSVQLVSAEPRVMERAVAVTGTLAPQELSTLSAKVPGRVERLVVDMGSRVRQGDVIAQIEP